MALDVALAIEVRHLAKTFGDFTAVADLSFEAAAGECLGLLGPNGAGKTTTVEILEGLQTATKGEVRLLGKEWSRDAEFLRGSIGISLQETRLEEKLTVRETVELFRSFYREGLSVREAIGAVRLEEKASAYVGHLSGGQRQRLVIALALVGKPKILFLDEPTTGLDPSARRDLWEIILGLKKSGITILITTHYMEEAERLCDRVVIVDHGKVIQQGTPAALIGALGGDQVIEFRSAPAIDAAALKRLVGVSRVDERTDGTVLSVKALHESLPALLATLKESGRVLEHLSTRQASLEDVFVALTGRRLEGESVR